MSQVVSLLTSLMIIKNFSPGVFGEYSYLFSIASICGSLATLKLELSIPVAKSFSDANSRTTLTLLVSLMLNVFMIILFSLLGFVPDYSSLLFVFLISCIVSINATFNQLFLQSESFIVTGFIPLILAVANFLFLQILNSFGGNPILFAFIVTGKQIGRAHV